MQKYIVLQLSKGVKIILSKKYYEDNYNGHTVTVTKKDGSEAYKFRVKAHGWNKNEVIYIVEEKEEVSHPRTLPTQEQHTQPEKNILKKGESRCNSTSLKKRENSLRST